MDTVKPPKINFNYRNTAGKPVDLKLTESEIAQYEAEWSAKIIASHKETAVPEELTVEVILSDDGSQIFRAVYLEDRPEIEVTPDEIFILKFIEMHPQLLLPISRATHFTEEEVECMAEKLVKLNLIQNYENALSLTDIGKNYLKGL
ncbi:hypothetical protein [Mucilaginibacter sp. FT3.2]|uniref:hypothetical protein n=1 Tax=Mucilaginibacter sp. FT3.2 TaxID=2723090 RepID=UPI00161C6792|nr:hypothetical protein [Mucilaginibacter sp. FT3.2]MBB6231907.1 hypothetical protein [Mucilaginibacter sp. FT3.2]